MTYTLHKNVRRCRQIESTESTYNGLLGSLSSFVDRGDDGAGGVDHTRDNAAEKTFVGPFVGPRDLDVLRHALLGAVRAGEGGRRGDGERRGLEKDGVEPHDDEPGVLTSVGG